MKGDGTPSRGILKNKNKNS